MTKSSAWLAAASILSLTLAPSVGARAENPDSVYCSALAKRYNQYLNETIGQGGLPNSLDGRVASEHCLGGDIKATIFVLEQKLTNAKLGLPKR